MPISIFSKFLKHPPPPKPQDQTPTFEAEGEDSQWAGVGEEGQLSIDLYQTKEALVLKSTIAGVKESDLSISITNDMLTIRGKRQKENPVSPEDYFYQECYWGGFSRTVVLPMEVRTEEVQATIKNGVLTIVMPKASRSKATEVKVKVE